MASKGAKTYQKKKGQKNEKKVPFKFSSYSQDDLQTIYSVQFNHHPPNDNMRNVFATAASNRLTIYKCLANGSVSPFLVFLDPDEDEVFTTCCWSSDKDAGQSILAAAGHRGVIRLLYTERTLDVYKHITGHGGPINELQFHPLQPFLLLSASRDHTIRLWNIKTDVCIALFGGVHGHRDEVLSADFKKDGSCFISSGIDHSLKIWQLDKLPISNTIQLSYNFKANPASPKPFGTVFENFPEFSTRNIHNNYIDCVKWYGNLVLSKSCMDSIICWKQGSADYDDTTIVHRFNYRTCDYFFIRFSLHISSKFMALGDKHGKTILWDLSHTDPTKSQCITLQAPQCTQIIRQTTFSQDGKILICVSGDGKVVRWDRCL